MREFKNPKLFMLRVIFNLSKDNTHCDNAFAGLEITNALLGKTLRLWMPALYMHSYRSFLMYFSG